MTYYDFAVMRGEELDPEDIVELFDVYAFSGDEQFDSSKRKLIIDALKGHLLK